MTQKQRVIDQIHHKITDFVPVAKLEFEGDVAERLDVFFGNSSWRSLVDKTDHILRLGAVYSHGVPVDEEQVFFTDIFGSRWRADRRPVHLEEPALKTPTLKGYRFPKAQDFLLPDWKEAITGKIEKNPDKFVVCGIGLGMFVKSWILRGFENALADSIAEPGFYEELLDNICGLHLDLLDVILALPLDGAMLDGDWGGQRGILLGPERWRYFIKPRLAKLYDRIHRAGKFTINHSCGNVKDIIPDLIEIGLDVLQSVQPEAMNPYELKKEFGKDITFWGGLGSQQLVPFGSPAEIRREVIRLCREMGRDGGYILGPAKAMQPETPTENAAAVVESFLEEMGIRLNPEPPASG